MAIDFKKISEEFQNLNPKDPGTWPLLPKLAALLAVLVAIPVGGYFADTQDQIDRLERGQNEEKKLKDDYLNKKKQAVNLELR